MIRFVSELDKFRELVQRHGILGPVLYVFCVILAVAVMLGAAGLFIYRYICNKQNREPKYFEKVVKGE